MAHRGSGARRRLAIAAMGVSTVQQTVAGCVALVASAGIVARSTPLGDLSRADSRLVRGDSAAAFSAAGWMAGDRRARGGMLAHFAGTHSLVGRHYREVIALLGPGECYVGYDDEPCYMVQLDGRPYALQFGVNHSDHPGIVVSAGLEEQRRASP